MQVTQTFLMFFFFQGFLLSIVFFIDKISNNDELYAELPQWAKEFDFFDTGYTETIDLDAIEGTTCLQKYF
jgi:hypothetical protein